jgi:hypothetical protein
MSDSGITNSNPDAINPQKGESQEVQAKQEVDEKAKLERQEDLKRKARLKKLLIGTASKKLKEISNLATLEKDFTGASANKMLEEIADLVEMKKPTKIKYKDIANYLGFPSIRLLKDALDRRRDEQQKLKELTGNGESVEDIGEKSEVTSSEKGMIESLSQLSRMSIIDRITRSKLRLEKLGEPVDETNLLDKRLTERELGLLHRALLERETSNYQLYKTIAADDVPPALSGRIEEIKSLITQIDIEVEEATKEELYSQLTERLEELRLSRDELVKQEKIVDKGNKDGLLDKLGDMAFRKLRELIDILPRTKLRLLRERINEGDAEALQEYYDVFKGLVVVETDTGSSIDIARLFFMLTGSEHPNEEGIMRDFLKLKDEVDKSIMVDPNNPESWAKYEAALEEKLSKSTEVNLPGYMRRIVIIIEKENKQTKVTDDDKLELVALTASAGIRIDALAWIESINDESTKLAGQVMDMAKFPPELRTAMEKELDLKPGQEVTKEQLKATLEKLIKDTESENVPAERVAFLEELSRYDILARLETENIRQLNTPSAITQQIRRQITSYIQERWFRMENKDRLGVDRLDESIAEYDQNSALPLNAIRRFFTDNGVPMIHEQIAGKPVSSDEAVAIKERMLKLLPDIEEYEGNEKFEELYNIVQTKGIGGLWAWANGAPDETDTESKSTRQKFAEAFDIALLAPVDLAENINGRRTQIQRGEYYKLYESLISFRKQEHAAKDYFKGLGTKLNRTDLSKIVGRDLSWLSDEQLGKVKFEQAPGGVAVKVTDQDLYKDIFGLQNLPKGLNHHGLHIKQGLDIGKQRIGVMGYYTSTPKDPFELDVRRHEMSHLLDKYLLSEVSNAGNDPAENNFLSYHFDELIAKLTAPIIVNQNKNLSASEQIDAELKDFADPKLIEFGFTPREPDGDGNIVRERMHMKYRMLLQTIHRVIKSHVKGEGETIDRELKNELTRRITETLYRAKGQSITEDTLNMYILEIMALSADNKFSNLDLAQGQSLSSELNSKLISQMQGKDIEEFINTLYPGRTISDTQIEEVYGLNPTETDLKALRETLNAYDFALRILDSEIGETSPLASYVYGAPLPDPLSDVKLLQGQYGSSLAGYGPEELKRDYGWDEFWGSRTHASYFNPRSTLNYIPRGGNTVTRVATTIPNALINAGARQIFPNTRDMLSGLSGTPVGDFLNLSPFRSSHGAGRAFLFGGQPARDFVLTNAPGWHENVSVQGFEEYIPEFLGEPNMGDNHMSFLRAVQDKSRGKIDRNQMSSFLESHPLVKMDIVNNNPEFAPNIAENKVDELDLSQLERVGIEKFKIDYSNVIEASKDEDKGKAKFKINGNTVTVYADEYGTLFADVSDANNNVIRKKMPLAESEFESMFGEGVLSKMGRHGADFYKKWRRQVVEHVPEGRKEKEKFFVHVNPFTGEKGLYKDEFINWADYADNPDSAPKPQKAKIKKDGKEREVLVKVTDVEPYRRVGEELERVNDRLAATVIYRKFLDLRREQELVHGIPAQDGYSLQDLVRSIQSYEDPFTDPGAPPLVEKVTVNGRTFKTIRLPKTINRQVDPDEAAEIYKDAESHYEIDYGGAKELISQLERYFTNDSIKRQIWIKSSMPEMIRSRDEVPRNERVRNVLVEYFRLISSPELSDLISDNEETLTRHLQEYRQVAETPGDISDDMLQQLGINKDHYVKRFVMERDENGNVTKEEVKVDYDAIRKAAEGVLTAYSDVLNYETILYESPTSLLNQLDRRERIQQRANMRKAIRWEIDPVNGNAPVRPELQTILNSRSAEEYHAGTGGTFTHQEWLLIEETWRKNRDEALRNMIQDNKVDYADREKTTGVYVIRDNSDFNMTSVLVDHLLAGESYTDAEAFYVALSGTNRPLQYQSIDDRGEASHRQVDANLKQQILGVIERFGGTDPNDQEESVSARDPNKVIKNVSVDYDFRTVMKLARNLSDEERKTLTDDINRGLNDNLKYRGEIKKEMNRFVQLNEIMVNEFHRFRVSKKYWEAFERWSRRATKVAMWGSIALLLTTGNPAAFTVLLAALGYGEYMHPIADRQTDINANRRNKFREMALKVNDASSKIAQKWEAGETLSAMEKDQFGQLWTEFNIFSESIYDQTLPEGWSPEKPQFLNILTEQVLGEKGLVQKALAA